MRSLIKYFVRGLLVIVPVALSLYLVYATISALDRLVELPAPWSVPGAGAAVAVVGTVVVGYLASNFVTRRAVGLVERTFTQVPLVKLLYTSIKDVMGAFVGDEKGFDRPVIVEWVPGVSLFGFVTRTDLEFLGAPGWLAVYVPQSYNFAGQVLLVAADKIREVQLGASEVMPFIVSGGMSGGTRPRD